MKNVINSVLCVAMVLSFGFSGPVWASEANDEVATAAAKLAEVKVAAAKKAAETKAQKDAVEQVRRSQRTYSEFTIENAKSAVQVVKAGVCAAGSVVATADGYAGYVIAYPAVYVTAKAFEGGNASWDAAASAWSAPVTATAK